MVRERPRQKYPYFETGGRVIRVSLEMEAVDSGGQHMRQGRWLRQRTAAGAVPLGTGRRVQERRKVRMKNGARSLYSGLSGEGRRLGSGGAAAAGRKREENRDGEEKIHPANRLESTHEHEPPCTCVDHGP
jgi:hypothetical protein